MGGHDESGQKQDRDAEEWEEVDKRDLEKLIIIIDLSISF